MSSGAEEKLHFSTDIYNVKARDVLVKDCLVWKIDPPALPKDPPAFEPPKET